MLTLIYLNLVGWLIDLAYTLQSWKFIVDQSILSKTFDLFSVLTLLFSVHNFKISFSAIRFLKAENMATTPNYVSIFVYTLHTSDYSSRFDTWVW